MKRAFDIILVLATFPLWGVAAALTALAVLLAMGRPVLFRQSRAGWHGKEFEILKFRTMRQGDGPDAERLTKLGRFLRKTSLDELPQLWLVLKGDMSLVGPRPLPVRYLARYSSFERHRHDTPPGMTGLAQVRGRNSLSWRDKFRFDVWYARNRSLCLDFRILLETLVVAFAAKGISAEGSATAPEFTS